MRRNRSAGKVYGFAWTTSPGHVFIVLLEMPPHQLNIDGKISLSPHEATKRNWVAIHDDMSVLSGMASGILVVSWALSGKLFDCRQFDRECLEN